MSTLKNYFIKGTTGAFLLKGSNVFLWLLVNIILARRLQPYHFGIYAYIISVINVLCMPAMLGLPAFVLREIASYRVDQKWSLLKGLIKRADQAVVIASICVILLCIVVAKFFLPASEKIVTFYIALPLLLINPLTSLWQATLRGFRKIILGLLTDNLLRPGLFLIFLIILHQVRVHLDERSALLIMLIASFAGFLFSFLMRFQTLSAVDKTIGAHFQTRKWIRGALPFILLDSMIIINNQTDIIMLGIFRTSSEVGLYKVATQGALVVTFILFAVNMTIGPVISELYYSKQMRKLQQLVTNSSQVVFCISLPIAMIFIMWGKPIINLFFGQEYIQSSIPLSILCAGQLFNSFMGPAPLTLNMTGNEKKTLIGLICSSIINIFLNLLLIPRFGIKGAAIATSISIVSWNIMLVVYLYKKLGILTIPVSKKILMISLKQILFGKR